MGRLPGLPRTSFNWVGLGFLPLIGAPTFWFQFRGATRESGGRLLGRGIGFPKPPPLSGGSARAWAPAFEWVRQEVRHRASLRHRGTQGRSRPERFARSHSDPLKRCRNSALIARADLGHLDEQSLARDFQNGGAVFANQEPANGLFP